MSSVTHKIASDSSNDIKTQKRKDVIVSSTLYQYPY